MPTSLFAGIGGVDGMDGVDGMGGVDGMDGVDGMGRVGVYGGTMIDVDIVGSLGALSSGHSRMLPHCGQRPSFKIISP